MNATYFGNYLYHNDADIHKYGLPEQKKFPMPDAAHVKSAIKFFNYVAPKDEEKLAHAILMRMKEYGMSDVNVGPDNKFSKYYRPKNVLQHSSILGATEHIDFGPLRDKWK